MSQLSGRLLIFLYLSEFLGTKAFVLVGSHTSYFHFVIWGSLSLVVSARATVELVAGGDTLGCRI